MILQSLLSFFFFFNDTATTEIYTLSLHDALPIYSVQGGLSLISADVGDKVHSMEDLVAFVAEAKKSGKGMRGKDRKSTRLNSSHGYISYAVFCLKKKKRYLSLHLPETVRYTLHLS